jgi:hypothetical protein
VDAISNWAGDDANMQPADAQLPGGSDRLQVLPQPRFSGADSKSTVKSDLFQRLRTPISKRIYESKLYF